MSVFHLIALVWIVLGLASALLLAVLTSLRPPPMGVMRLVWPLTGLYGGPVALWLYFTAGRRHEKPFAASVALATTHCGGGCSLGDLIAEMLIAAIPAAAAWLASPIVAGWILDTALAYLLGIGFQYFAIQPMSHSPPGRVLAQAVKADTLSLIAWQAGMIGFMALVQFAVAPATLGAPLRTGSAGYWFAMQLAMLAGFGFSYPVNWFLVKSGVKHAM